MPTLRTFVKRRLTQLPAPVAGMSSLILAQVSLTSVPAVHGPLVSASGTLRMGACPGAQSLTVVQPGL